MNILALDTCFDACSAAAGSRLRSLSPTIAFEFEPMATGQAERLMPMIETAMHDAKLEFSQLQRIAVTIGPGTFTGTRIAVSAARALALATGAELVPVSALKLMAMSARIPATPASRLAVVTDARRDEVYLELFDRFSLRTLFGPALVPLAKVAEVLTGAPVTLVGSGAAAAADAVNAGGGRATALLPDVLPDAFSMLFWALEAPTSATVSPLYLRPPDAKPPAPSPLLGGAA